MASSKAPELWHRISLTLPRVSRPCNEVNEISLAVFTNRCYYIVKTLETCPNFLFPITEVLKNCSLIQHRFLESTFLSCSAESYEIQQKQVESINSCLSSLQQQIVRFCRAAQKSRNQAAMLTPGRLASASRRRMSLACCAVLEPSSLSEMSTLLL